MSEPFAQLEWLVPLAAALTVLLLSMYVLNRYRKNRVQASLYWGIALIAQAANLFMESSLHSSILTRDAASVFVAQVFSATVLALFYAGVAVSSTKRIFFTRVVPLILFFAQILVLTYLDFITGEYIYATVLQMGIFGFPLLILFGAFFFWDYMSQRRRPSLILGVGWWIIAAALPLYAVTIASESETVYHIVLFVVASLMFIGFVVLARKPSTIRRK